MPAEHSVAMGPNENLLDLLLELQTLDNVPRSGYFLRGIQAPESVSEHAFHTAFLVWSLAVEEPELDAGRALELALVHDVAEVRTGDLPRTASRYLPQGAKRSAERAIAEELLLPLGQRGVERFAEYQAKSSREARFVAACDRLQLLIKSMAYERWGARGLGEFWRHLKELMEGEFLTTAKLARELDQRRRDADSTPAEPVSAGSS